MRLRVVMRALLGLAVLIGLGFAWIVHTGMNAESELRAAKNSIRQAWSKDANLNPAGLVETITDVSRHCSNARASTNDPVWWLAAHIPFLGRTPLAIQAVTQSLDDVARASSYTNERLTRYKRPHGVIVDRTLLAIASQLVDNVQEPVLSSKYRLDALNLNAVPSLISEPIKQAQTLFDDAEPYVQQGQTFIDTAPLLLGLDRKREWLVIMDNGAEARSTGGLPGGWGVLTADAGRVELTHLETNTAISARPLANWQSYVSESVAGLYGADLAHFPDMNLSPDFPTNARLMNALYQQQTGKSVDGVVIIDQFTLAGLMVPSGPVHLNGRTLTSGNVAEYITKGIYRDYPNPQKKDEAVMEITRRVFGHLSKKSIHEIGFARALIPSIFRGRFHAWAKQKSDQEQFLKTPMAGSMQSTRNPTHMAVVINGAGNKIDAYVGATVTYEQKRCSVEVPYRTSQMTISLNNAAPRTGLPSYVTPRNDLGVRNNSRPGSTFELVYVHVPAGAVLRSATIGGKEAFAFADGMDSGRQVWGFGVELPASANRALQVAFDEPADLLSPSPVLGLQPMAIPMITHVIPQPNCGSQ